MHYVYTLKYSENKYHHAEIVDNKHPFESIYQIRKEMGPSLIECDEIILINYKEITEK